MSTATLRTPTQQERATRAAAANMQRDDWYPRYGQRATGTGISPMLNVVFPSGTFGSVERLAISGRYQAVHDPHSGRFRTRDEAARAERAQAIREWKEQDQ